jgi:hypothetical protein
MFFLNIAIFAHKLILDFFQFRAINFLEFTAFKADEMVVMLMAVLVLISQRTISKVDLSAYT